MRRRRVALDDVQWGHVLRDVARGQFVAEIAFRLGVSPVDIEAAAASSVMRTREYEVAAGLGGRTRGARALAWVILNPPPPRPPARPAERACRITSPDGRHCRRATANGGDLCWFHARSEGAIPEDARCRALRRDGAACGQPATWRRHQILRFSRDRARDVYVWPQLCDDHYDLHVGEELARIAGTGAERDVCKECGQNFVYRETLRPSRCPGCERRAWS